MLICIGALFCLALVMTACKPTLEFTNEPSTDEENEETYTALNDPYGLQEAKAFGGQPSRLIDCSKFPTCPEYAQALFWVGADILSRAGEKEIDASALGITPDMNVEDAANTLMGNTDKIFDAAAPNYDLADSQFQKGLRIMHRAHDSGNVYASNELGLLFLQQDGMVNINMASQYFQSAMANGDSLAMYNLARVAHMKNPNDHSEVLKYLKLAAEHGDAGMKTMYVLGLEAFGDKKQRLEAQFYKRKYDNITPAHHICDFIADFRLNYEP